MKFNRLSGKNSEIILSSAVPGKEEQGVLSRLCRIFFKRFKLSASVKESCAKKVLYFVREYSFYTRLLYK